MQFAQAKASLTRSGNLIITREKWLVNRDNTFVHAQNGGLERVTVDYLPAENGTKALVMRKSPYHLVPAADQRSDDWFVCAHRSFMGAVRTDAKDVYNLLTRDVFHNVVRPHMAYANANARPKRRKLKFIL